MTGSSPHVVVVGAGPVGCTAALLLADQGLSVTILERQAAAHPLPRAVHLDDEVLRALHAVGVSEDFLVRSRPATGLRLLDARHQVMAEFQRELTNSDNGFPFANMFHQPDLEGLLLDRVAHHPKVSLVRGVEVTRLERRDGSTVVNGDLVAEGRPLAVEGQLVLGCDGAGSAIRQLAGIEMEDLGFTERWLVIDVQTNAQLDTWGGVEQICDPARAATFMRVVDDRYRWEFQLQDGEEESDLLAPAALAALLKPWTGREDLAGLELVRSATYTFRARVAQRFSDGDRVFLLGDAAHLTPPFIGQGLGAGIRDAVNLAWKAGHVLTGRATPELLATYDEERRPHARALVKRAVTIGWAMTGGQDRAAHVRKVLLAAAVRVPQVCAGIASPVTPPLKGGALSSRTPPSARALRPGRLLPNPPVRLADGSVGTLDEAIGCRPVVLVSGAPTPGLTEACRRQGVAVVRLVTGAPSRQADWLEVSLIGAPGRLRPVLADRELAVLVRPDRVVASLARRGAPVLPWTARATDPAVSPVPARAR